MPEFWFRSPPWMAKDRIKNGQPCLFPDLAWALHDDLASGRRRPCLTTVYTADCRPGNTSRQAVRDADIVDFSGRLYRLAEVALAAKAWPIKALPTVKLMAACRHQLPRRSCLMMKNRPKNGKQLYNLGLCTRENLNSRVCHHQLQTPPDGFQQGDAPALQT